MSILSAMLLLFLVLDPLGNIPFFLSILKHIPPRDRRRIILRENLIAYAVLVAFLFGGRWILVLLNISEPGLSIAGGLILFLIAIRMIFYGGEQIFGEVPGGEPYIVPLAIPSIAGPSSMATVLLLMAREPERWPDWLLALTGACLLSGVILYASSLLIEIFGERVLIACERLMGMLLTTVAVEMFIAGVRALV